MGKRIEDYQDHNGFIGHKDARLQGLEFGDCGQRTGSYAYLTENKSLIDLYTISIKLDQEYVRYPTYTHPDCLWYTIKGCMSRDNFLPIVLSKSHDKPWLRDAFIKLLKHGFFLWNTKHIWSTPNGVEDKREKLPDFGGVILLLAFIRSSKVCLWLTHVLDLNLLANVLIRSLMRKLDKEDTGDDINLSMMLIQAYWEYPTYLSNLSTRLYFKLGNPIQAIRDYFQSPDAPPLDELITSNLELIRAKVC